MKHLSLVQTLIDFHNFRVVPSPKSHRTFNDFPGFRNTPVLKRKVARAI